MKQGYFGTLQDGRSAQWLEIENEKLRVRVSDYGATLVSLWLKDAQIDAVLGFDEVSGYQQSVKYMGAMIGRVANRIKDGQFTLDGHVYSLCRNDKGNTLHGGQEGFDAKLWTVSEQREDSLTLRLCSPAGEEGFPAEVTVTVTYALAGPRLSITTRAESTAATPISLTITPILRGVVQRRRWPSIGFRSMPMKSDCWIPTAVRVRKRWKWKAPSLICANRNALPMY